MKYWISKYAVTSGVFCVPCDDEADLAVIGSIYGLKYAHETEAAALEAAEEMRIKKIASLRKQIERLERMGFE